MVGFISENASLWQNRKGIWWALYRRTHRCSRTEKGYGGLYIGERIVVAEQKRDMVGFISESASLWQNRKGIWWALYRFVPQILFSTIGLNTDGGSALLNHAIEHKTHNMIMCNLELVGLF
jgi:hypothetical protein